MSLEELQTATAPQVGLQSVGTDWVQHTFHAVTASLPVLEASLHAQSVLGGTLQLIHRVLLQDYRQSEVALVQMPCYGAPTWGNTVLPRQDVCSILVYILFQSFKDSGETDIHVHSQLQRVNSQMKADYGRLCNFSYPAQFWITLQWNAADWPLPSSLPHVLCIASGRQKDCIQLNTVTSV